MKLTLHDHPSVGEAVAFLDSHCCRGELDEMVVDEALSRLPRAEASRLLAAAADRLRPGGTLVVRDVAVFAAAAMVADGAMDGEAALTDRRSFWTAAQVESLLPGFRPQTRRVSGGVFEVSLVRDAA